MLELLLKYLCWPAVVLLLGISALVLFRREFRSFIDRTRSVGKGGWLGGPSPSAKEQSSQDEATPEPPAKTSVSAKQPEFPTVFSRRAATIRQDLQQKNLDTESKTAQVLIDRLAIAEFLLMCEQVYGMIFGSQITLLKQINTLSEMAWDQVLAFYREVHDRFPALYGDRTAESYVDFLVRFGLLGRTDKAVSIKEEGTEFLLWMIRAKKTEARHG